MHSEHGFGQAPYEEITKEKYEELIKKVTPISKLEAGSEILEDLGCEGGVCPIR